jgi:OOP family OmpA-OmpF porin
MRIQFDIGSHRIREDSIQTLVNLTTALNDGQLKALPFSIVGHTDVTGSLSLNMRLSRQRADAVVAFLVEHGVARDRLVAQGKGPSKLLPNEPPESAAHRRVEVTLRTN